MVIIPFPVGRNKPMKGIRSQNSPISLLGEIPGMIEALERNMKFKKAMGEFCNKVIGFGKGELWFFNGQRFPFSKIDERFKALEKINWMQENALTALSSSIAAKPLMHLPSSELEVALDKFKSSKAFAAMEGPGHWSRRHRKLLKPSVELKQFSREIGRLDAFSLLKLEDVAISHQNFNHIKKLGILIEAELLLWENIFQELGGLAVVNRLISSASRHSFQAGANISRFLSFSSTPFTRLVACVMFSFQLTFGVFGAHPVGIALAEAGETIKNKKAVDEASGDEAEKGLPKRKHSTAEFFVRNTWFEDYCIQRLNYFSAERDYAEKYDKAPDQFLIEQGWAEEDFKYAQIIMDFISDCFREQKEDKAKELWDTYRKAGVPSANVRMLSREGITPNEAKVYFPILLEPGMEGLLTSWEGGGLMKAYLHAPMERGKNKQWSPEDFQQMLKALLMVGECNERGMENAIKQAWDGEKFLRVARIIKGESIPYKDFNPSVNILIDVIGKVPQADIDIYLQGMETDRNTKTYYKYIWIKEFSEKKIGPEAVNQFLQAAPECDAERGPYTYLIAKVKYNLDIPEALALQQDFGFRLDRFTIDLADKDLEILSELELAARWLNEVGARRNEFKKILTGLKSSNGITHFYRFSPEQILKIRSMSSSIKPEALVVLPRSDHNGAFTQKEARKMFDTLFTNFDTHVVEVENEEEFYAAIEFVGRNYGLISFLVISGHGNPLVTSFGDVDPGIEKLKKGETFSLGFEDVQEIIDRNLQQYLAGDVIIWSDSCLTAGQQSEDRRWKNLADAIHHAFAGKTVIGSKTSFSIGNVTLEVVNGRVTKLIIKDENNTVVFRQNITRI